MNYSWSKWKRGLLVAIITGLFTGGVSFVAGAGWKPVVTVIVVCICKDALLYLNQHPVDSIADTAFIAKPITDAPSGLGLEKEHEAATISPVVSTENPQPPK